MGVRPVSQVGEDGLLGKVGQPVLLVTRRPVFVVLFSRILASARYQLARRRVSFWEAAARNFPCKKQTSDFSLPVTACTQQRGACVTCRDESGSSEHGGPGGLIEERVRRLFIAVAAPTVSSCLLTLCQLSLLFRLGSVLPGALEGDAQLPRRPLCSERRAAEMTAVMS